MRSFMFFIIYYTFLMIYCISCVQVSRTTSNRTRTRKTTTPSTPSTTTVMPPEEFRLVYPVVMSIENVVKQALRTFGVRQSKFKFQENFNELMIKMNQLTLTDVYLTQEYVTSRETGETKGNPITYMQVYQDGNITVSVFILQDSSKLPIHDHPIMHGILKVIAGNVSIQSYSLDDVNWIKQRDIDGSDYTPNEYYYTKNEHRLYATAGNLCTRHPVQILSPKDPPVFLTPFERNIHEVTSVNGTSAFLDILAPPYYTCFNSIPRECTYFEEIRCEIRGKSMLAVNHFPPDYWTDDIKYRGPPINITSLDDS